jgi:DNA-binding NtrC family response regulator
MLTSRSASSHLTLSPPEFGAPPACDESGIVGSSAAMHRLRQQVKRIGPHFRTVLVSGEAGTGKELVARALHRMSPAASGPFVVCPATEIPATEIKDALARRERSDVTGDDVRRLMRRSARGTLFLDRVNELPFDAQVWLLRALTQYELTQKTDLRIVASTGEDLRILVSTGRFSQELYQRLATVEITLPPLRERHEDLPELARHFLGRFATVHGRSAREIADEAMERMQQHPWPGNVSELESVLRNTVLRSDGQVLQSHDLPLLADKIESEQSPAKTMRLQDVIEQHVLRVLKECGGNKLRASELLGISRSTLYRMLGASASVDALR